MTQDDAARLEAAAVEWVRRGNEGRHLMHARDWLRELAPDAGLALVLATLTHDVERHVAGGPSWDPFTQRPDEREYLWQHSVRSAQLVHPWLYAQGAGNDFVREVEFLVLAHELGGDEEADLLQAADSLSFLELEGEALARAEREGAYPPGLAAQHVTWIFRRIRPEHARELARPLYEQALATVGERAA